MPIALEQRWNTIALLTQRVLLVSRMSCLRILSGEVKEFDGIASRILRTRDRQDTIDTLPEIIHYRCTYGGRKGGEGVNDAGEIFRILRMDRKHSCLIKNSSDTPSRRYFVARISFVVRTFVRAIVEYLRSCLSIINASPCCVGIRVINCLRLMLRIREGSDLRAVNVEAHNRRHPRRFIYTWGS